MLASDNSKAHIKNIKIDENESVIKIRRINIYESPILTATITNLVAYFHWGKRLLGNLKHHFRDLCWVGALSGSGGK